MFVGLGVALLLGLARFGLDLVNNLGRGRVPGRVIPDPADEPGAWQQPSWSGWEYRPPSS